MTTERSQNKGCGYLLNKFIVDTLKLKSPTIREYSYGLFPDNPEAAQAYTDYLKSLIQTGNAKIFHGGRDENGKLKIIILTPNDLD